MKYKEGVFYVKYKEGAFYVKYKEGVFYVKYKEGVLRKIVNHSDQLFTNKYFCRTLSY